MNSCRPCLYILTWESPLIPLTLFIIFPKFSVLGVTSGNVDKTQTGKSTSSNGSYHIYCMPDQVGVGGPRSNGTLSSNGTHYEFDDTLPRVLQSHYELEPGSPKYTDPMSPSATLPSQYEIPISVPSTLPSSEVLYLC